MSLLLDALRRAAAAKQGPAGDRYTMPRRGDTGPAPARPPPAAARDDAAPEAPVGSEEGLALEPREDTGAQVREAQEPDAAAPADSGSAAAARAVLHSGRRRRGARARAALALGGGFLVVAAALAAGSWYYYRMVHSDVSRDLASFQPTPEATPEATPSGAAEAGAGDDAEAAGAADSDEQPAAGDAVASAAVPRPGASAAGGEDAATAASGDPAVAVDGDPAASARPAAGSGKVPDAGDAAAGAEAGRAAESAAAAAAGRDTERAGQEAAATTEAAGDEAAADEAAADDDTTVTRATTERAATQAQRPRRAQPMVQASTGQPLTEALQAGYEALQAGDLVAAAEAYRRARRIAPDNRDALLGSAAVAQRRGQAAPARALYQRILDDHPRDPHARAGLASLDGARDPRRSESELKMLLRERPQAASLHFALGNIYAAESRWADAQEAYFEAVRAAPGDAAYAYNLAVALDHLGRRAAAQRHYERAVRLADGRNTGIPVYAVERRLRQLRRAGAP